MSQVLFNPTDDELKAQYGGITVTIPKFGEKGHIVKFEDAKARHLLNQLSPRGLTSLEYGDTDKIKEQKAKDGRRRSLEFKRKQVANFNRENEERKAQHRAYNTPPDHIVEMAKEIGVGLIEPYVVQDVKNEEISKLREETKEKDKKIDALMEQVSKLLELHSAKQGIDDVAEQIAHYKSMNRHTLKARVLEMTQEGYTKLHIDVQSFLRTRWEEIFDKGEDFPY